jgi:hypothetical protein
MIYLLIDDFHIGVCILPLSLCNSHTVEYTHQLSSSQESDACNHHQEAYTKRKITIDSLCDLSLLCDLRVSVQ